MTLRLERLGPRHAGAILAGQDAVLAEEIIGARWDPEVLDDFLERAARWRDEGPIREYAAMLDDTTRCASSDSDHSRLIEGELLGGGGLNLVAPGLGRGQAALTYWLLAEHRGRGHGLELAGSLVDRARSDARIAQLVLRIAPHNEASRAIARRLGAVSTGTRDRHPADASRLADRWVLDLR
ncbi:MAG: GNAT family N-acetyltransferase [Brachybacterium sp.]|uniref:GNAT family N-acetyltransferase n=1 Tax=Brachybacterium sp. TaxID=1891286 RepID=UPI00264834F9|nr:GNAT family protein [Brachybacterium sp.]MDN5685250.1 GNAT family N-acetyltransferase [Brachybacterium sp.]